MLLPEHCVMVRALFQLREVKTIRILCLSCLGKKPIFMIGMVMYLLAQL